MHILLAMSGGVDSSAAAVLLMQQGAKISGVTLALTGCGDVDAIAQASAVSKRLGFKHEAIDGRKQFEKDVLRPTWETYVNGRTPNPCAVCNRTVKFELLLQHARAVGADMVATGHHAQIVREGEVVRLRRGADRNKDQSYFLFALTADQLARSLFPVGKLKKHEVRRIAKEAGLDNAEQPESQDACFAQSDGLADNLSERFGERGKRGVVRDMSGHVLGTHDGIHRFTIGQRKGLGIALGTRAYVVRIDAETGDVVLGSESDLEAGGLVAHDVRWHGPVPQEEISAEVQIRYRHKPVLATVTPISPHGVRVVFDQRERAVTPGQAAVFYRGDDVIGGAWIAHAIGCSTLVGTGA